MTLGIKTYLKICYITLFYEFCFLFGVSILNVLQDVHCGFMKVFHAYVITVNFCYENV